MAQWLFKVGAAEDIRTKDNNGSTPLLSACNGGHLDVAHWLFEVGAAEDIRTKNNYGRTPLLRACDGGHLDVAQWLILAGAANNVTTGHVDQGILTRDVRQSDRPSIRGSLVRLIDAHCVFARLVVPATCIISATTMAKSSKHQRPGEGSTCLLPRLVGHEESLLSLVADFLGIVRGRELRYAREAIGHFEE